MLTAGDLASSVDQSDKVREMQDKIASLRAQVRMRKSKLFLKHWQRFFIENGEDVNVFKTLTK